MYLADTLVYSATPQFIEMIRKRDKLKPAEVMQDYNKYEAQLKKLERSEKYGIANEIGYIILNKVKEDTNSVDSVSKFFRNIIQDVDHQAVFLQHIFRNKTYFKSFVESNKDILQDSSNILSDVVIKCLFSQG